MTAPARMPAHVPTLTEVVSWQQGATPTAWTAPPAMTPDLAREVEARVLQQVQQLLPGLVAQALKDASQTRPAQGSDN